MHTQGACRSAGSVVLGTHKLRPTADPSPAPLLSLKTAHSPPYATASAHFGWDMSCPHQPLPDRCLTLADVLACYAPISQARNPYLAGVGPGLQPLPCQAGGRPGQPRQQHSPGPRLSPWSGSGHRSAHSMCAGLYPGAASMTSDPLAGYVRVGGEGGDNRPETSRLQMQHFVNLQQ